MNHNIILTQGQIKKILGDDRNYQAISEDLQNRILERISQCLIEEDFRQIDQLNQEDDESGSKVKEFLLSKVPNLDKIIAEETQLVQRAA